MNPRAATTASLRPRPFNQRRAARAAVLLAVNAGLLILVALAAELALRVILPRQNSPAPPLIAYPRFANNINGFNDQGFTPANTDGRWRILCLGGSTSMWQSYPQYLAAAIAALPSAQQSGKRVLVVSAGEIAHTSRDSYLKYRYWYDGYEFDAVVFYQAINDLRVNNCPRAIYKPGYTHLAYYHEIEAPLRLSQRPILGRSFLLVFLAKRLAILANKLDDRFYQRRVPQHQPRQEWLKFGGHYLGLAEYQENVRGIARLARERHQPLLLQTFCSWIPPEYSEEAFKAKVLPYTFTGSSKPVELWGVPNIVQRGLSMYNDTLRQIASEEQTLFLDQAAAFPTGAEYFIDVCHFTPRGAELLTRRAARALEQGGVFDRGSQPSSE